MDVESDADVMAAYRSPGVNRVKFYPKQVRMNYLSEQQGTEVFEWRDYIIIYCPGMKDPVNRLATETDRKEYPAEYAAYKEGKELRINGTPLTVLGLPQSRVESLNAVNVYTVEQLAQLSGTTARHIGLDASQIIAKAQAFLQKNSTEVVALKQELAERDAVIRKMEERLAALESGPVRKKPGRPPKAKEASLQ
jgi:hypothetical protein